MHGFFSLSNAVVTITRMQTTYVILEESFRTNKVRINYCLLTEFAYKQQIERPAWPELPAGEEFSCTF